MERRKFVKTAGAVGVGAAFAGCSEFGGGNETGTDDGGPEGGNDNFDIIGEIGEDSVDQLKFQDVDLYRLVDSGDGSDDIFGTEEAGAGVRGVLKNTADQAYQDVEVQVTLYDETDDILGEWLDNTEESDISYLNPGQTWQWNVVFEGADIGKAARYTVSASGNLQSGGDGAQNETDGMQNESDGATTTTQS